MVSTYVLVEYTFSVVTKNKNGEKMVKNGDFSTKNAKI